MSRNGGLRAPAPSTIKDSAEDGVLCAVVSPGNLSYERSTIFEGHSRSLRI
jgi:hypothetical protein